MMLAILTGDAIEQLRTLPTESVHCCVTSPPYWGLRDYGTAEWEGGEDGCEHKYSVSSPYNENFNERWGNASGAKKQESERHEVSYKSDCGKCGAKRIDSQLGLEKTPEEYVAKMVEVFREVRRVLRKDGTLWLNLGDTYSSGGRDSYDKSLVSRTSGVQNNSAGIGRSTPAWAKPKDLLGIPWRVAFALQADGWWLRSDIIWAKPNPMPESVTDRPTKSHEYLFLLTKSANYFYDAEAIKERGTTTEEQANSKWASRRNGTGKGQQEGIYHGCTDSIPFGNFTGNRNKRSVWTVATAPYPEAHFATYPPDLIKPCILAGTSAKGCCAKCGSPWERVVETNNPSLYAADSDIRGFNNQGRTGNPQSSKSLHRNEGGVYSTAKTIGWQQTCYCTYGMPPDFLPRTIPCTVLDPFAGSGTTGAVAMELGRKAILIELNPKYVELIKTRCNITPGLALA